LQILARKTDIGSMKYVILLQLLNDTKVYTLLWRSDNSKG